MAARMDGAMLGPAPRDIEKVDDAGRLHPIRKGLQASQERLYQRHAEPDWPEWAAREFLRLCYVVFFMAVVILGALQIDYSLLPYGAPPVMDPTWVAVLAIAYVVGMTAVAGYGYYYLWRSEGYVDRWAADRKAPSVADAKRERDEE